MTHLEKMSRFASQADSFINAALDQLDDAVEQVVVTINTLIRRQAVQLGYFTESNVPAGILNAPNGWSADTIMTMQDAWDLRTAHPTSDRSKLVWVPEGTRYQPFKDAPLKDEFDEWLYRVICYAFSVPPSPFVKQMNFATAGQADDQGKEEGISGRKLWWKEVADAVIQHDFGFEDLEWAWIAEQDIDPDTQNTIDDRDLRNGSRTLDEVRHRRGLPVRGQRTRTNARTRKGPRKAIRKT